MDAFSTELFSCIVTALMCLALLARREDDASFDTSTTNTPATQHRESPGRFASIDQEALCG